MDAQNLIANFQPQDGESKRAGITEYLRDLIISGRLAPGTKLPPMGVLAQAWGTHPPAVQAAMTTLVKEGLIERLMGRGTFVREQQDRLSNVALFISGSRWVGQTNNFVGHLMHLLEYELRNHGIRAQPWIARRNQNLAGQPLEELVVAAKQRDIQGVIVAELDHRDAPWLLKLPVPVVFLTSTPVPNRVILPFTSGMSDALPYLASEGCRSVGLISVLSQMTDGTHNETHVKEFFTQFMTLAEKNNLATRDCWIKSPPVELPEKAAAKFGFAGFHELWNQSERPDSLLVYTDVAAQGALMALSQRQVRVPDELRLVLHRNSEMGLFCPVPASFIDVSISEVAVETVKLLIKQHQGIDQAVTVTLPKRFIPQSVAAEGTELKPAALAG